MLFSPHCSWGRDIQATGVRGTSVFVQFIFKEAEFGIVAEDEPLGSHADVHRSATDQAGITVDKRSDTGCWPGSWQGSDAAG